MKKAVAAFALGAALLPALAAAQSSLVSQIVGDQAATEKLYFSLKAGIGCTRLTGVEEDRERLGGPNIGLFATIRLADRLWLVPEVDPVSRRGLTNIPYRSSGDPALDLYFDPPDKSALVLNYVDVPVLVKYRLSGRIHVAAGPFVGFLLSASERFRSETETGEVVSYTTGVGAEYRPRDYGFVVEASVVVTKPRRGTGLVFHVRYQGGLADIAKDPAASGAVRTSALQVFVSFPFIH
jgi:Outer membrane protein beta-barrel domain